MAGTKQGPDGGGNTGAFLAAGVPGIAQEKPADTMEIVLEKIRADKKLLVAENLQLTEAEAKGFWPVYSRYQDELFLLRTSHRENDHELRGGATTR